MSDIVIIYVREDADELPAALETQLGRRWSVFWDGKISHGQFTTVLTNEIENAGCLVPILSKAAADHHIFRDELEIARDANVPIVPIRIHNCRAPLGFNGEQRTDILGWKGEAERSELAILENRIEKVLSARGRTATGAGRAAGRPVFYYSVSSHETRLDPPAAVEALEVFGARKMLVSAYDIDETRGVKTMLGRLESVRKSGGTVLLDCGNYERFRRGEKPWTQADFHESMARTPHDMAFSWDSIYPKGTTDQIIRRVAGDYAKDAKKAPAGLAPIVHLPRIATGGYRTDLAPELVRRAAEELSPQLIAIPERELGDGLFARARTIASVRAELAAHGRRESLHILGAGTPASIALFTAAGADSFDGLEWCRYVADGPAATLHHFHHFDLYADQARIARSEITRQAADDTKLHYSARAVFHNLDFYDVWLDSLRVAMADPKRLVQFMTELLPRGAMAQAQAALPDVL